MMQAGMSEPSLDPIFIISLKDKFNFKNLFNKRINAAESAEPPPKPEPIGIFFFKQKTAYEI